MRIPLSTNPSLTLLYLLSPENLSDFAFLPLGCARLVSRWAYFVAFRFSISLFRLLHQCRSFASSSFFFRAILVLGSGLFHVLSFSFVSFSTSSTPLKSRCLFLKIRVTGEGSMDEFLYEE